MIENILNPWPWYISGPLIGLTVPFLLIFTGKALGISSSFQNLCQLATTKDPKSLLKEPAFKKESWKIIFALGLILGGFLASHFLSVGPIAFLPLEYHSVSGGLKLLVGGFLVGFGSRYAEGCTSGHAITGLASLQAGSAVAVLGFFGGGLSAAGITFLLGS